jgi:hypothetical protein
MTTETNLTITVSNVRPSTISGCETGLDMDVRVGDHEMEATLLDETVHGGSQRDRIEFRIWGSPDNWLSDPSRYSREQLREIADACEAAASTWSDE